MTPDQALSILDQATSKIPMDRMSHLQVIEALKVLGRLVHPAPVPAGPLSQGPVGPAPASNTG